MNMKRFLAFLLVMVLLVPAAALAAKEKPEKPAAPAAAAGAPGMPCPMCQMMGPGKGMMGMHLGMGMGAERWWRMGAMSMWVCEILKEANGILARGNLTPDGQKQLGQALAQLCGMIPVVFSPQEVEKPEEMMQKLKDLEALLEKIEAQARGK